MINVLENVLLEKTTSTYLNTIKAIYEKPIANILLNLENLEVTSLKSGTRQSCSLSQFLFNVLLGIIAGIIQERKIRYPCLQMICNYPLEIPQILPEIQNQLTNPLVWQDTETTYSKQQPFYTANKHIQEQIIDTPLSTIAYKKIKYLGIN